MTRLHFNKKVISMDLKAIFGKDWLTLFCLGGKKAMANNPLRSYLVP
jgi:hypothetical protein